MKLQNSIDQSRIEEYCRKWKISEMSLFGSALRDDFTPDSDYDFLVKFAPEAEWSLLDHVRMEMELKELLGRKVDIVSRRAIEQSRNWIRRNAILESTEVIYAAR